MLAEASRCLKCTYLSCSRRMDGDSRQLSRVQNSRMNWAIGHGSNGGRLARRCGYWRRRMRTSSLLQSQKAASSSRSSSGVSRSDENVVRAGVSETGSATTAARFFLTDFMAILPRERSNNPVGGKQTGRGDRPTRLPASEGRPGGPNPVRLRPEQHLLVLVGGRRPYRPLSLHSPAKTTDCNKVVVGSQASGLKIDGKFTVNPQSRGNVTPDVFVIPYLFLSSVDN